ncbi:MAG: hypothetical protein GWP19_07180 [Planctomycetia bacterium]|nr:hypothetical protein [Planctomycetia bacterium]
MPITRIEKVTDGLNELINPRNLPPGGLQESINYEMLGDDQLTRRKDPVEYGDDVSGDSLKTKLAAVFTQSILQISPPLYPVKKIVDDDGTRIMDGDFIILVYGATAVGVYELYMCYENTVNTWGVTKVEIENIKYVADTYLEFFVGDDKLIITDTMELTPNLPHYVKVDAEGVLITGRFGVPSPTNRATVELVTEFERNDYEDVETRARLGDCGIFQCAYTIVTEEGDESNPSPISESRNMQFFEKDAVDFNDARWISSVIISNLSIPNVSDDLTNRMKYFNVYYRIIRYSEGSGAQPFLFSQRFEILDKINYSGETGNQYAVTVESDLSDPNANISYENDILPIAQHAAESSSIVGFGNVREKVSFPFDFHRYASIKVNNVTNKNYVDGVVQITIYDENHPVDDITVFEVSLIDELDLSYYAGSGNAIGNVNQIRIFDTDMKTMLPVIYDPFFGGTFINIYVKIPLMLAGGITYLYLCFNKNTDSPYGVDNADYQNAKNGQWMPMGEDWDNQQLFQPERVKNNSSVICVPNEIKDDIDEVLNRVNTLDNGTLINDATWVQDRVGKTLLVDGGQIGAVRAIQLPNDDSSVQFDNLNLAGVTRGYYYGRFKYDSNNLEDLKMNVVATLSGDASLLSTVCNIMLGIRVLGDEVSWHIVAGYRGNVDLISLEMDLIEEPVTVGEGEYFVCLSFDKDNKASLFVANLTDKSFRYQEKDWDDFDLYDDELELNQVQWFELGFSEIPGGSSLNYRAIPDSIYDQWQYVNGEYLSAKSLDDKTAVYNIANYMPSFDRAIGIKLL